MTVCTYFVFCYFYIFYRLGLYCYLICDLVHVCRIQIEKVGVQDIWRLQKKIQSQRRYISGDSAVQAAISPSH